MDLILAYLAGLLTLLNPCVLPVLPIVLQSALQQDRRAPVALALGMSLSFVALGLGLSALGPALGLSPEGVARGAGLLMAVLGAVMLVPRLAVGFEMATAGLAAHADAGIDGAARGGLGGQAAAGLLLGAAWSPCIGPTLGAAIALASRGEGLGRAGLVMAFFAAGVSTLILGLAYGARSALRRRQAALRSLERLALPIMGATFVVVGLALFLELQHPLETWLLDNLPPWLTDLSVAA